ncbi:MAG: DUF4115 domain-containing protein [Nitrospiraceae bacterium]
MDSIGEFFKQVRETKGLTVDEVALKTRIRADFVRAIEDGNYAKLPDQVFARGFVRSYARSLGLDEDDAINRFVNSAGSFYEKQGERERLKQKQDEEDRRKRSSRKAVGFAIVVALGLLVVLLTKQHGGQFVKRSGSDFPSGASKSATAAPKDGREGAEAVVPVEEPREPRDTRDQKDSRGSEKDKRAGREQTSSVQSAAAPSASVIPSPPSAIAAAPAPAAASQVSMPAPVGSDGPLAGLSVEGPSAGEPLFLDLEAVELSWVVVQIDGGSPVEALMRPGQRARWKANDQFAVTLGNAGGVKAELNGKPQKPFGPSGKVVRDVVLKRDS